MLDVMTAAMGTLIDKVAFGVQELDRLNPEWDKKINLDILSMNDGRYCVLGQLYGDYLYGCNEFDWTDEDAKLRGLCCSCDTLYIGPTCRKEYDEMDELWSSLIVLRRALEEV